MDMDTSQEDLLLAELKALLQEGQSKMYDVRLGFPPFDFDGSFEAWRTKSLAAMKLLGAKSKGIAVAWKDDEEMPFSLASITKIVGGLEAAILVLRHRRGDHPVLSTVGPEKTTMWDKTQSPVESLDKHEAMNKITEVTRRKIFDYLILSETNWPGRLSEIDFLSRLYDLDKLPSTDWRYKTAALDIQKHRVFNEDWENDWVCSDRRFELQSGSDELLLRFLCEMLHPVVRTDQSEAEKLKDKFNEYLKADGYEIYEESKISGHPLFAPRELGAFSSAIAVAQSVKPIVDQSYISIQISRMESAIATDPALAIGTAKDLIETVCKSILDARSVPYTNEDVMPLVKLTITALRTHLMPNTASDKAKGEEMIKVLLNNLATVCTKTAELRNLYGTGHGKAISATGLEARHARLVVHSAAAAVMFLFETHHGTRTIEGKT